MNDVTEDRKLLEGEDGFGIPKFLEVKPEVTKEADVGTPAPTEAPQVQEERRPL